jgi:tRNA A37 methylthiotransferase MiaB
MTAPRDRTLFLHSTADGCQTNLMDNALFRRTLRPLGWVSVDRPEDAAVIVVNTCAFDQAHERESVDTIADYRARFPRAEVITAGCLTSISEAPPTAGSGGFTVGPGEAKRLAEHLAGADVAGQVDEAPVNFIDPEDMRTSRPENRLLLLTEPLYGLFEKVARRRFQPLHNIVRTAAFNQRFYSILVSTGCMGTCTYCAIKKAKGSLRSRPLADILADFRRGLDAGHRDFWLVADDVGCWGHDIGASVADLLAAITAQDGDFRLVLNYIEPRWFMALADDLERIFLDQRIVNVNMSMQSGSERVIHGMGRRYDPQAVVARLDRVKASRPDLVLKTHLMVGFPGETEEDFQQTLALVEHFDLVIPFSFTARPGTPAASLPDQLPEPVKARRRARLVRAILRRYWRVIQQSLLDSSPPAQ